MLSLMHDKLGVLVWGIGSDAYTWRDRSRELDGEEVSGARGRDRYR